MRGFSAWCFWLIALFAGTEHVFAGGGMDGVGWEAMAWLGLAYLASINAKLNR